MPNDTVSAAAPGLPSLSRRALLGGFLPATAALAVPALALASPQDRARRAWAEFSAAMRDLTADAHGWIIIGAGERQPFGTMPGGAFLNLRRIEFETGSDPRCPRLIVERHHEIIL